MVEIWRQVSRRDEEDCAFDFERPTNASVTDPASRKDRGEAGDPLKQGVFLNSKAKGPYGHASKQLLRTMVIVFESVFLMPYF